MAPTLYATRTINVNGSVYEAGTEIKCGKGARQSLLRCGHATEGKSSAATPKPSGKKKSKPKEPEQGQTRLEVLELEASLVKTLAGHKLETVEQLDAFLADGKRLSDLKGIGEPTEAKILDALDEFKPPAE